MSLLSMLPGFPGMFQSLSGEFVSAHVILFSVMLGGCLVGMGGEQMKLGSPLVCVSHDSPYCGMGRPIDL
jgi:hypothetical protein